MWDAVGSAGGAFEEVDGGGAAVEDPAEVCAHAEGPVHGAGGDAEDAFEFVHEGEGIAGWAIEFIHEGEDGDAAAAADLEELAGLAFDAFTGVDDHDGGVDGGEDAVGVFGEVAVAGGIEEIDDAAAVFELKDGGADGDAPLFFHFHPVGGCGALVFAGGDGACEVEGAAEEEEFFGEGGFPCVRVGDDGEGAPALDFFGKDHLGATPALGGGREWLWWRGVWGFILW